MDQTSQGRCLQLLKETREVKEEVKKKEREKNKKGRRESFFNKPVVFSVDLT